MALVRDIDADPRRQAIVHGLAAICGRMGIRPLGEGVETAAEYAWLAGAGIDLFQGYYFGRPALEALPEVRFEDFRLAGVERERQVEFAR